MNLRIKSIRLRNFRSHVDTLLDDLGPAVSIEGGNSVGKTALFEATEIALFSRDFPVDAIRHGADEAIVEIELADEDGAVRKLERRRDKTGTTIKLKYPDGRKKTINGVANSKRLVQEFTGFRDIKIDSTKEENVQIRMSDEQQSGLTGSKNYEGTMKRVAAIVSSAGFELAKALLQKKSRELAETVKSSAAVVEEAETRVASWTSPVWDEIEARAEELDAAREALDSRRVKCEAIAALLERAERTAPAALAVAELVEGAAKLAIRAQKAAAIRIALDDRAGALRSVKSLEEALAVAIRDRDAAFEPCERCGRRVICLEEETSCP